DIERDASGHLARVLSTQAPPTFESPITDRATVARALGLDERDLHATLPPQVVSTGTGWLIVPLADVAPLARVSPDVARFEAAGLRKKVYPFAFTPRGTRSRGIVVGAFEDPVTGSASGCLGAYLAHHRALADPTFVNEQGAEVGRPGRVTVEVAVDAAGEPRSVAVGGACVEVLHGEVALP
ncbi:MAG: PhzF family phenazine biosynthesis protein, partial [Thermoplasmatota archaeon]